MLTRRIKKKVWGRVALVILVLFAAWSLFPIFWMLTMSLKSGPDALAMPPKWLFIPTLANFKSVLADADFERFFMNSLMTCAGGTLAALVIGTPAAYVLARFDFKGRKTFDFWILSTRMGPAVATLIPFFLLFRAVHLLDSIVGLIIVYLSINLPLVVWMMKSYFLDVPKELEEAAMVDGCGYWTAFFRIVLPVTLTGAAATSILSFLFSWNVFMFALVLTGSKAKTAPVALYNFVSYQEINWTQLSAAGAILLIPVLIFVILVQRDLVRGMTMGIR
jgi:multiple sugar transport system permease protein